MRSYFEKIKARDSKTLKEVAIHCAVALGTAGAYFLAYRIRKHYQNRLIDQVKSLAFSQKTQEVWSKINQVHSQSSAIVYFSPQRTQEVNCAGVPFTCYHLVNLERKVAFMSGQSSNKINPFIPPFEEGVHIMDLGISHRLFLNKFALIHKHVLVTTSIFEMQTDPVNSKDFEASFLVLKSFPKAILFLNGGKVSGASLEHKHIQIVPIDQEAVRQSGFNTRLLEKIDKEANRVKPRSFFEFSVYKGIKHLLVRLPGFQPSELTLAEYSETLKELYDSVMEELKNFKKENEDVAIIRHYNLVMSEKWMMVVIRRKEAVENDTISINSLGFMGKETTQWIE